MSHEWTRHNTIYHSNGIKNGKTNATAYKHDNPNEILSLSLSFILYNSLFFSCCIWQTTTRFFLPYSYTSVFVKCTPFLFTYRFNDFNFILCSFFFLIPLFYERNCAISSICLLRECTFICCFFLWIIKVKLALNHCLLLVVFYYRLWSECFTSQIIEIE